MCLTSLFTVEAATGSPVISVTAEAATYKTGTYKVTHKNGVNVRKKASTSSTVVGASAKGTTFTVKEIKRANGLDWGRTDSIKCTNGKKSGWVALKYCTYQAPKSEPAKPAEITFKGVSFPSSITKGKGQHLAGTISSTQNITKIKAVVDNYTTDKTVMEYTVKPNSKSYALYDSSLDWSLSFGKLSEGDYRLTYHVWSGSTTHSMNMLFSVKAEKVSVIDSIETVVPNDETANTDWEKALNSVVDTTIGETYKCCNAPKGEAWCGYYGRYILLNAIKKAYGCSAEEAKQMIPYNSLTGTCTTAYTFANNPSYGNYYSFADWSYYYESWQYGTWITAKGTNSYSSKNFTPKVGSIVLTETNERLSDGPDHIAIIIKVNNDGSFVTAEGNTNGNLSVCDRVVKTYTYVKNTCKTGGQTITSWARKGMKGDLCTAVIGICEPYFLNNN